MKRKFIFEKRSLFLFSNEGQKVYGCFHSLPASFPPTKVRRSQSLNSCLPGKKSYLIIHYILLMILETQLISLNAQFFSLQNWFFSKVNFIYSAISVKLVVSHRPAIYSFARFLADALLNNK